jgi:hypothetical protein
MMRPWLSLSLLRGPRRLANDPPPLLRTPHRAVFNLITAANLRGVWKARKWPSPMMRRALRGRVVVWLP